MPDSVDRPAPLRTVTFPPRSRSTSRSYAARSGAVVNAVSTSASMRRTRAQPPGVDDRTLPRSHEDSKSGQSITRRYKLAFMIDAAGLRVMRAIANEGSFTGAAVSLGYSQPAISQMVRRLEQRAG